jgi:hypothetical protein
LTKFTHEQADPDGTELPSPTTTGPGTVVVVVVAADVASVALLPGVPLVSGAEEAVVDCGSDTPELPPPQPETTTMTNATTNHRTERFW